MILNNSLLLSLSSVLASFVAVTAFPHPPVTNTTLDLAKRGGDSAPRFVAYWDTFISGQNGPPDPSNFAGYNVVILSFLLSSGAADQATAWASLSDSQRSSIKQQYNNAGIKLMVSAFGATDSPTSAGHDPTQLAQTMASWVKEHDLDGIDVDYEDFSAVSSGRAASWLVTFTRVLRENLPQGEYMISHAPVAPWFASSGSGVYLNVNQQVGDQIDFYNVQFYNQGNLYETCDSLVSSSGGAFPGSSILEISSSGVDKNKLVVGKIASTANGNAGGFIDAANLATCVSQAKAKGWSGGVMGWQYPTANSEWIKTVRSQSWPV